MDQLGSVKSLQHKPDFDVIISCVRELMNLVNKCYLIFTQTNLISGFFGFRCHFSIMILRILGQKVKKSKNLV